MAFSSTPLLQKQGTDVSGKSVPATRQRSFTGANSIVEDMKKYNDYLSLVRSAKFNIHEFNRCCKREKVLELVTTKTIHDIDL